MRPLICIILVLGVTSCQKPDSGGVLFDPASNTPVVFGDAPVAVDINANNTIEEVETIITLNYSDTESDIASSCSISSLVNISESTSCSCDSMGVCTVGITPNHYGTGTFDYEVVANSQISNAASVSTTIISPFVSTWETTTPNETITLPLRPGFNYNMTVDWGDGTAVSEITSDSDGDKVHTYVSAGEYTITINGIAEAWYFNNVGDKDKIKSVTNLGNIGWINLSHAFHGCSNLEAFAKGNTENVTSMFSMFNRASKVTPNTTTWVTSNVSTMGNMFAYADLANPDTSTWDTGNVTTFGVMFRDAFAANPDTSNWDTSKVTSMNQMFYKAALAKPDTSGWDTSKVTRMSLLFANTPANPDTSNWDTSEVTQMDYMFYNANLADPDTSNWDTSKVTNMNNMFNGASIANPDTSGWDTLEVTQMAGMFYNARLANPDTSNWNTSKVTLMQRMFNQAWIAEPDTSNWDTSEVTSMQEMFAGAFKANPDTSNWDTSKVTNMAKIFTLAAMANPDVSGWDTSEATDMSQLFDGASIANPDTSTWDTTKVTTMQRMFRNAFLAQPDFSTWNFSNVTSMYEMFINVSLPTANYTTLIDRVRATSAKTNISMHGGQTSLYNASVSGDRASLVADGWIITDGGQAP